MAGRVKPKPMRVLALTQEDTLPPEGVVPDDEVARAPYRTDYDVRAALCELGHEVVFAAHDTHLEDVRDARDEQRPHVVFNLLEMFDRQPRLLPHLLGYLELAGQAYTGCNPVGMLFASDKALQRKILRHHRIATPEYATVPIGRTFRRPKRLEFPLIVKSATEHGSQGIARASVVTSDEKLTDRIQYMHDSIGTAALVEEFIEGRELYVGVLGNKRLETFPVWEMRFTSLPEGAPNIATGKLKWDIAHQEALGLETGPARGLGEEMTTRIHRRCKRAYRALEQSGYARFDLRVRPDGRVYVIESNPNPELAWNSEFPASAKAAGYDYPRLLQRIMTLGQTWHRTPKG